MGCRAHTTTTPSTTSSTRVGSPGRTSRRSRLSSLAGILAYFSPVNADELLAYWRTDREAAIRKIRIAERLVGFDNLLKQPADLLRDEVQAYAQGVASPPKTL